MRGTLIYVMGPSGSGKDSLLSALRPRLRGLPVAFARRYISRPACAGGEQHMALSAGSILSMEARGRLAMRWSSHGCQYGIGRSIDGSLEHGICVIVNGSREYLPEALRRYPDLLPVLVEVEPAILRQRLLARGREQGKDLEERLQRAGTIACRWPGAARTHRQLRQAGSGGRWPGEYRAGCPAGARNAGHPSGNAGQRCLKQTFRAALMKKGLLPCGERALLLSMSLYRTHSRRVSMRTARHAHAPDKCAGSSSD